VVEQRLVDRGITDLRYYNSDVHRALFALPNFFRDLLPQAPAGHVARKPARVAG
jgi:spermidine synthase